MFCLRNLQVWRVLERIRWYALMSSMPPDPLTLTQDIILYCSTTPLTYEFARDPVIWVLCQLISSSPCIRGSFRSLPAVMFWVQIVGGTIKLQSD